MLKTSSTTSVELRPNKSKKAIAFVERHGVVLQAARGPVPSLAEAIAGESIRGSWWGHAKGREIFRASRAVCESPEVLVCKLVDNKVTYVHRRVWPALIKLAPRFDIMKEAERLSTSEAERILSAVIPEKLRKAGRRRMETRRPSLQSSPCQGQPKAQAPGQRRT